MFMSDIAEYKVNVHADPIDGYSMDKYDFECQFYVVPNRFVTTKNNLLLGSLKLSILPAREKPWHGLPAIIKSIFGKSHSLHFETSPRRIMLQ